MISHDCLLQDVKSCSCLETLLHLLLQFHALFSNENFFFFLFFFFLLSFPVGPTAKTEGS